MKKKIKQSLVPLLFFLTMVLTLGSLYIKNIGPKTVGDNDMHLYNTYIIATGKMNPHFKYENEAYHVKKMQAKGPKNVVNMEGQDAAYEKYVFSPLQKDLHKDTQYANSQKNSNKKIINFGVRTQYPPLNWIVQAAGYKTGQIFNKSPYTSWQLARLFNLFAFIMVMSLAIILVPRGKWIFTLVGTFPLSVFLAASVSADAVNISVSSLFVAYILYLREKAKKDESSISLKDKIIIGLLVVIFFNLKVAYVPMLILVLLIPNFYYSLKDKIVSLGISGFLGLLSYLLWSSTYSSVLFGFLDAQKNIDFVKNHLFTSIVASVMFVITYPMNFISNMESDYGSKLGAWTLIFIAIIMLIMFIANYGKSKPVNAGITKKVLYYWPVIISLIAYVSVLLLITFVLLSTWTKLYSGGVGPTYNITNIQGFQARYLLPLIPMLATFYALDNSLVDKSLKNDDVLLTRVTKFFKGIISKILFIKK